MKKMMVIVLAMVFGLSLGSVYAADVYNGVSDFTGRSYDEFELEAAGQANYIEGSSAGGVRVDERDLYNGATDFTGMSYDTFTIASADADNMLESSSAGGLRTDGSADSYNGITDFSGKSYDTHDIRK